jgi:hypothetical protein
VKADVRFYKDLVDRDKKSISNAEKSSQDIKTQLPRCTLWRMAGPHQSLGPASSSHVEQLVPAKYLDSSVGNEQETWIPHAAWLSTKRYESTKFDINRYYSIDLYRLFICFIQVISYFVSKPTLTPCGLETQTAWLTMTRSSKRQGAGNQIHFLWHL